MFLGEALYNIIIIGECGRNRVAKLRGELLCMFNDEKSSQCIR
jgi:hypothetical protein